MGQLKRYAWGLIAIATVDIQAAVPNTFTANTTASASRVNANFSALDTRITALEGGSLKYLGSNDFGSNNPDLGVTVDSGFGAVTASNDPNANPATAVGTATTQAAGFQTNAPATGTYVATASGSWAVSLFQNDVTTDLELSCVGPTVLYTQIARFTLGTASAQTSHEGNFTVSTWVHANTGDPITCALNKKVVAISDPVNAGTDITLHKLGSRVMLKLEQVGP